MTPADKELYRKHGYTPTGNKMWDEEVLRLLERRELEAAAQHQSLSPVVSRIERDIKVAASRFPAIGNPEVYRAHANLIMRIANDIILAPQHRQFVVDDNNRDVIRFLLYYFNQSPMAETVFPDRGYKLHKNLLIVGPVGVGKTMLMQIFSEYLRRVGNPLAFSNVSVTQLVNHHSIHNNIDLYTYNETGGKGFNGNPLHLCLNDIGVDNRKFYGVDTLTLIHDFLHARNEIWVNTEMEKRFAHLTTNLPVPKLKELFAAKDSYGRVLDRFKTYNVICLDGKSRR